MLSAGQKSKENPQEIMKDERKKKTNRGKLLSIEIAGSQKCHKFEACQQIFHFAFDEALCMWA